MRQTAEKWLIPDRKLAAQTKYNLRRAKKQIEPFKGAGEVMNHHIDALIKLLDSCAYQGDFE